MKRNYILFLTVLTIFITVSCTKNSIKTENADNSANTSIKNKDEDKTLEKKYMKEGFINNDIYRIVILATQEESKSNMGDIKDKGKNRIKISLQKLLLSKSSKNIKNLTTDILNLVNQYGEFIYSSKSTGKYKIYYYEIRKTDLKKYLTLLIKK